MTTKSNSILKNIKPAKSFFLKLIAVILSLPILFLGFPILLLIFGPTCLIRKVIQHLAKWCKPQLGKMLSSTSAHHAQDDLRATVVTYHILEGIINLDQIREQVQSKIIDAKCPQSGERLYPELQQNITSWMGFPFWIPVTNFRIQDHVYIYENNSSQENKNKFDIYGKDGASLIKSLTKKPWPKNKGLIECIIIPEIITSNEKTCGSEISYAAVIFRFHHALCDAGSMLHLIDNVYSLKVMDYYDNLIREKGIQNSNENNSKIDWFRNGFKYAIFPFKMAYDIAFASLGLQTGFKLKPKGEELKNELSLCSSEVLYNSDVKSVALKYNVTFSTVLMAMIASGIRQTTLERFGEVEKDISIHCVIPLPNHPKKLRNHSTMGFISLPLTENNSVKRLEFIHNQLEWIKNSTIPYSLWIMTRITGCQFSFFLKRLVRHTNKKPVLVFSNIPWAPIPVQACGYPIRDFNFTVGLAGTGVVLFSYLSYAGCGKVMVNSDTSFLNSTEEAEKIIGHCINELNVLKELPLENKYNIV